MPWRYQTKMSIKKEFVEQCLSGGNISRLCRLYGISRKTGYKWLERYKIHGAEGLLDLRVARPDRACHYAQTDWNEIFALRQTHPSYGARKLRGILLAARPGKQWPSISRIKEALKKNGFIAPRRRVLRKIVAERLPLREYASPNTVWCMDFKGWFLTKDKKRCEPLTLLDGFSRYLFACIPLPRPDFETVKALLEKTFHEYGKPEALRTDNGFPFGSSGFRGLSPLSVWLLKQGIWPEKIQPGHPGQNGRLERLHRTLKSDVLQGGKLSFTEYAERMKGFLKEYNHVRPHEALGDKPPAQAYVKSPRAYTPGEETAYEYPPGYRLIQVNAKGYLHIDGQRFYLTESLAKEFIGVGEEQDRPLLFLGYPLGFLEQHKLRSRIP